MNNLSNQILLYHSETVFLQVNHRDIYVADFTERTKLSPKKRSVEITNYNQQTPDGSALMDSLVIRNSNNLLIEFSLLHDTLYTSCIVANNEHCEGCFYNDDVNRNWVVFFELKDCLPKNVDNHREKAIRQIINVVDDFRGHSLITGLKLFGIVSCPRKKVAFNDTIVGDMFEARNFKRITGITLYGSNEIFVMDENNIRPVI